MFYTFTGQEDDDELGLYNYKARLYDPLLGRFISPDSIVPNPEDPQSLNRYSYCLNNPLKYTDPSGHENYAWGYDQGDYTAATLSSESGTSGTTESSGKSNNSFFSNLMDSAKGTFQSWLQDPLGSKALEGGRNYGYGDINLTVIGLTYWGFTFSVQITEGGYVYVCPGLAAGTPGASYSATMSNYSPSPGAIVAVQGNLAVSGQLGYSFETGSLFGELGASHAFGFSLTGSYCFGPFGPVDSGHE